MDSSTGSPGFFAQLFRFFQFKWIRSALGIGRAANTQFTGSVEGIRDAVDLELNKKVKEYKELESAVSGVEMQIEAKKLELQKLNVEEKQVLQRREGAL